jgi:hypothetical protein
VEAEEMDAPEGKKRLRVYMEDIEHDGSFAEFRKLLGAKLGALKLDTEWALNKKESDFQIYYIYSPLDDPDYFYRVHKIILSDFRELARDKQQKKLPLICFAVVHGFLQNKPCPRPTEYPCVVFNSRARHSPNAPIKVPTDIVADVAGAIANACKARV